MTDWVNLIQLFPNYQMLRRLKKNVFILCIIKWQKDGIPTFSYEKDNGLTTFASHYTRYRWCYPIYSHTTFHPTLVHITRVLQRYQKEIEFFSYKGSNLITLNSLVVNFAISLDPQIVIYRKHLELSYSSKSILFLLKNIGS